MLSWLELKSGFESKSSNLSFKHGFVCRVSECDIQWSNADNLVPSPMAWALGVKSYHGAGRLRCEGSSHREKWSIGCQYVGVSCPAMASSQVDFFNVASLWSALCFLADEETDQVVMEPAGSPWLESIFPSPSGVLLPIYHGSTALQGSPHPPQLLTHPPCQEQLHR
jgi:hypothetical protein